MQSQACLNYAEVHLVFARIKKTIAALKNAMRHVNIVFLVFYFELFISHRLVRWVIRTIGELVHQ